MISLLMLLVGCGPKQSSTGPQSMSLAPSANVHLRNSFDTDPSAYLGRFVKDSAKGVYDESSTMSLACSEHVTYRRINGGGVKVGVYNDTHASCVPTPTPAPTVASAASRCRRCRAERCAAGRS